MTNKFERREYDPTVFLEILSNPLLFLQFLEAQHSQLPIVFSSERGGLPVLVPATAEKKPVVILANCGAQLMNSPIFFDKEVDQFSREVVESNERSVAPQMLAYSLEGDEVVFSTSNPERSVAVLHALADTYDQVAIPVSRTYTPVESVDGWLESFSFTNPLLPNVLEPRLIQGYFSDHNSAELGEQIAQTNIAAYTKDGIQQLWEVAGVPTPETAYFNLALQTPEEAFQLILDRFPHYDRFVINRCDGSGGFGIVFAHKDEVLEYLYAEDFENQRMQVQGFVSNLTSPCMIANITEDDIQILGISQQRFGKPGEHIGNFWSRDGIDQMDTIPGFIETNYQALVALQRAGVVGQVNIDSLLVADEVANALNLPTTIMREANIRPAGSSVLLRLQTGLIDGQRVDFAHTTTKVHIPFEVLVSGAFGDIVDQQRTAGKTHAVVYNYNHETETGAVAFLGSDCSSHDELDKFEQSVFSALSLFK